MSRTSNRITAVTGSRSITPGGTTTALEGDVQYSYPSRSGLKQVQRQMGRSTRRSSRS